MNIYTVDRWFRWGLAVWFFWSQPGLLICQEPGGGLAIACCKLPLASRTEKHGSAPCSLIQQAVLGIFSGQGQWFKRAPFQASVVFYPHISHWPKPVTWQIQSREMEYITPSGDILVAKLHSKGHEYQEKQRIGAKWCNPSQLVFRQPSHRSHARQLV